MNARIDEFLDFIVNKATAALIRQPQTEVTDLSFVAQNEAITDSTPTNQELLKSRSVKSKTNSAPNQ